MEFPDLSTEQFFVATSYSSEIPETVDALAVGWLGARLPAQRIDALVESDAAALEHLARCHQIDSGELGYHGCELCRRVMGRGEFLFRWESRTYVAPILMLHYVRAHGYVPPKVFLDDLRCWWISPLALACRHGHCYPTKPYSILEWRYQDRGLPWFQRLVARVRARFTENP